MLSIVGLGNPGPSYKMTKHNAGFIFLDEIVEGKFINEASFDLNSQESMRLFSSTGMKTGKYSKKSLAVEGEFSGKKFQLIKPVTFMNESGIAVRELFSKGVLKDISELLVVVDDVDLDLGKIRLRTKGSASGHNGLKSLISHLGTNEFTRLRIGVGPRPDGNELIDYVLGKFRPDEYEIFKNSLTEAADYVVDWMKQS